MRWPSSTNRNAEIAPISTQPSGWPRDWPPPASALLCDTHSIAVVEASLVSDSVARATICNEPLLQDTRW